MNPVSGSQRSVIAEINVEPPITANGSTIWNTFNHFAIHGARAEPVRHVICKKPTPIALKEKIARN